MSRMGTGANQVSHHTGWSPVPQNSIAEVGNAEAGAARVLFFVAGLELGLADNNSGCELIEVRDLALSPGERVIIEDPSPPLWNV